MKGPYPAAPKAAAWELALPAIVFAVTTCLAASGARAVAPASSDDALVRVVGLQGFGATGALQTLASAPFLLVPLGTRALRAALASAVFAGVAAALAATLARRVALAGARVFAGPVAYASAASPVAALAASLAVCLGPLMQAEARSPGSASVFASVVVLATALAAGAERIPTRAVALLVGLAFAIEPIVGSVALVAALPGLARPRPEGGRAAPGEAAAGLLVGLAPLAILAVVRARGGGEALPATAPEPALLRGASDLVGLVRSELGPVLVVAGVVGAAVVAYVARRTFLGLLATLAACAALAVVAPVVGARSTPLVLIGLLVWTAFASAGLAAGALAISRAKVPFARASAVMVFVLELVLPVRSLDESLAARERETARGAAVWDDLAWGRAPAFAVLLVSEPWLARRVAAARAVGALRPDLLVVPLHAPRGRSAARALAAEPKLLPVLRDVALGGVPEELSLSQLAAERPVLATFDVRWERTLARHLVASGLLSRYEPEPRSALERRRELEAFAPAKERLLPVAAPEVDAALAAATAAALRARALGCAAASERDLLSRALDDLRPFAQDDAVSSTLVRRIVTSKGSIEVRDLGTTN